MKSYDDCVKCEHRETELCLECPIIEQRADNNKPLKETIGGPCSADELPGIRDYKAVIHDGMRRKEWMKKYKKLSTLHKAIIALSIVKLKTRDIAVLLGVSRQTIYEVRQKME
jgi:hypothetical protein